MSDLALDIRGLSKTYRGFALRDVSFSLPRGYVMGLIGPNGAGKTTIVKLVMNLVAREAGEVRVFGLDSVGDEAAVKSRIGFVYDEPRFYDDATLDDHRRAFAGFYPAWSDATFDRLARRFELPRGQKFKTLSNGMKRKFALLLALSHGADLLILDNGALVNPGTRIPPSIEACTGISNDMVADAPAFEDLRAEVRRRLERRLFVAHNARFDYGFVRNEFRRLGEKFSAPVLCTVRVSRALFREHARHNLDALLERYDLDCGARHRALGDAAVLPPLLAAFEAEAGIDGLQAAAIAALNESRLPPHLSPISPRISRRGPACICFAGQAACCSTHSKANVVLPSLIWAEAEKECITLDGIAKSTSRLIKPIHGVRSDAEILREISKQMNKQQSKTRRSGEHGKGQGSYGLVGSVCRLSHVILRH